MATLHLAPSRTVRQAVGFSGDGGGPQCSLHDQRELGFVIRLLNGNGTWLERAKSCNIATDENVRNRPDKVDCINGGDAASLSQLHIDDDQIRSASRSGGDC